MPCMSVEICNSIPCRHTMYNQKRFLKSPILVQSRDEGIMLTVPYARPRVLAVGHVRIYHVEDLFFTILVSGKQKSVDYFLLSCLFTFLYCPTGLAAYIHYCSLYFFLTLISVQPTSFIKNTIAFYDSLVCPI